MGRAPDAARGAVAVASSFDASRGCWSRYQTLDQMVREDPGCSTANPMFSEIDQPGVGRVLAPGMPLDFEGEARMPAVPAPLLGQHTEEVLGELLGIDSAQFRRLHNRGVVGSP